MAKRSDKKDPKLPIIGFYEEFRELVSDEFLDHCNKDSFYEVYQDPFIDNIVTQFERLGASESIGHNVLVGYMLQRWDKNRTVYKFTKSIMTDLLSTPYPSIPLSSLNLPFRTYVLDLSELDYYDLQGDHIESAIIHYETDDSPEAVALAQQADEMIQKAIDEGKDLSKFKDQLTYLFPAGSNPFERITFIFLKQIKDTWSHYSHFEIVRDHMHLPISEMPEMATLIKDKKMAELVKAAIYSMVYLSTEEPDVRESEITRKTFHKSTKLKNTTVRQMDVGIIYRNEKKLAEQTRSLHAETNAATGMGTPKRSHWRKAHFHSYWIGKGRYKISIKWLSPIHVNEAEDVKTITIRIQK